MENFIFTPGMLVQFINAGDGTATPELYNIFEVNYYRKTIMVEEIGGMRHEVEQDMKWFRPYWVQPEERLIHNLTGEDYQRLYSIAPDKRTGATRPLRAILEDKQGNFRGHSLDYLRINYNFE